MMDVPTVHKRAGWKCVQQIGIAGCIALFLSFEAIAWENHQAMMESWLRKYPGRYAELVRIPCQDEEKKTLSELAQRFSFRSERVPIFSKHKDCSSKIEVPLRTLLLSSMIDEPDMGMDQDLPDAVDPGGERRWMGGSVGPTSQGFRHMYFAGFQFTDPLRSFQIPLHAVGQAPNRYVELLKASNEFQKISPFFSVRLSLWAAHLIQDLSQPFHVRQVLSLSMLPFKKLFSGFVAAATQSIANYHLAYEGYVLELVKQGELQELDSCFLDQESDLPKEDRGRVMAVVKKSVDASRSLGPSVFELFGPDLKSSEIDLAKNMSSLDYYAFTQNAAADGPRKNLERVTCEQIGLMLQATVQSISQPL
jgi:hypothetical protein